ncbi:protection of telomeres protein 1 isoform X2 [Myripristis murdjan]|uniref:protection of telomeres protein 1 isoform X2 n=1 Tax=Myripristis murdjan TaxID=586833 RepID=UPI001175CEB2|nr:protection of telomeres protein 1 isoform X2 [Myripristis murdjan]
MRSESSCQFETERGKASRLTETAAAAVMPVHVAVGGASAGSQVPAHLTRIPISLVSTDTDCSDKTVQGKVLHKGPLVSLEDDGFLLKIIIQEEEGSQPDSISVVVFGGVAQRLSEAVRLEDVVVASGFTVGKSPTFHKDKLHPCNLYLSGDAACVYVSRPPPAEPKTQTANKRSSSHAEVPTAAKVPKYSYVPLSELKPENVVNVYGVVVFFKQPFRTRGTDLCSSLKITDQSNKKVCCTIFCSKLEDHPKIFQTRLYNDSIALVNTFGFSAVTFDGTVGGDVEPRTSSRNIHFDEEDRRVVEELRSWAAAQTLLPPVPRIPLSAVQPKVYFDLTCQLLSKASIDSTCTLLRVWDGTRCPHPLLKVAVEPGISEGTYSIAKERQNLVANVLVYDNHVELARQLKPGSYLRIYNLRALPGASKLPGNTGNQSEEADCVVFHLHGGTAFGRGIRILPENSPNVQELKRITGSFTDDDFDVVLEQDDSAQLEIWCTPPESPDPVPVDCGTERSCSHGEAAVTLAELKRAGPRRVFHVRAQLRSYEPRRLHQALKLHCHKCQAMQDVPDDDAVAAVFSAACGETGPCGPTWALSGQVDVPAGPSGPCGRTVTVYMSDQLMAEGKGKDLVYLLGVTLEETCRLASAFQSIVPVRSSGGRLALLDPPAPFLFRGTRRHYGCGRCSEAQVKEPCVEGVEAVDERIIAEALGVQLLQPRLLVKLELQDATDTLEVFLWRDAESFFHVSAEDVAANQEAQDRIRLVMDSLCPPGGSMAARPWLDLCLTAYAAEGRTCYQICNTVTRPAAAPSDPA